MEVTAQDVTDNRNGIRLTWARTTDSPATYSVYKWDDSHGRFSCSTAPPADRYLLHRRGAASPSGRRRRDRDRAAAAGQPRWWTDDPSDMLEAREGLDGVRVEINPMTTSGMAARMMVAGGRTSNDGTNSTTAESLGLDEDGSVDSAWHAETPSLGPPRAYFALLSSQPPRHRLAAGPPGAAVR